MEEYVLGGVPVAGVIIVLVQMAKALGLPSRFAMPLAVVLGVALYATFSAVKGAMPEEWWVSVAMGILAGGFASGAYSGTKALTE